MKIFKYPLLPITEQTITCPEHFLKILCVKEQYGDLVLYAETCEDEKEQSYKIFIYGTGHEIDCQPGRQYIGTVCMSSGLVWHVYYENTLAL